METEATRRKTLDRNDCWIAGASLAVGAAIGATVMYLYDPNRGSARRARLQSKAASAARRSREEVAGRTKDLLNRAKGLVARVGAVGACREEVDDDVLAGRVRSHLGHLTGNAHSIESDVRRGIVTLQGTLSERERNHLIAEIEKIPGVKEVRDRLAVGVPA